MLIGNRAYSRKIVGYKIADNMDASTVAQALAMGIKGRRYDKELIHHSDRRLSIVKEYVDLTIGNNIDMSMTENGDPYENALAERMNKTIKEEFYPDNVFKSRELAIKLTKEAITLYNQYRPHLSLRFNTPDWVHNKKIPAIY